jgi:hypothetical protein
MGTGKYPEKDAGYMDCSRFVPSKKTLTRGAGLYMDAEDFLCTATMQEEMPQRDVLFCREMQEKLSPEVVTPI